MQVAARTLRNVGFSLKKRTLKKKTKIGVMLPSVSVTPALPRDNAKYNNTHWEMTMRPRKKMMRYCFVDIRKIGKPKKSNVKSEINPARNIYSVGALTA